MSFFKRFRPFLTSAEKKRVSLAIHQAELKTSGEIHVHLNKLASPKGVLAQAERVFFELGLEKTEERNGVLILIAISDRHFAIWGDQGIHQAAGQPLWDAAREALQARLKEGKPCAGLEECVARVGEALAKHFPASPDDKNQLSDEVTES